VRDLLAERGIHVDHRGQLVDFRLTARRDAKAAKAFLRQAKDNARLYQPMTIVTDKAPTYARVIGDWNMTNFLDDPILHVDRKWRNNIVESDHAAMKRPTTPGKGFQSLRTAKATRKGIEAIRTIKRGHVTGRQIGITGEVSFVNGLFGLAA
jgi:IS6 family transposase